MNNVYRMSLLLVVQSSCGVTGDNSLPCTTAAPLTADCRDAQQLAKTDSESLVVKQETVSRYFDRLVRARQKEPLLWTRPLDGYTYGVVQTFDDHIGTAWLNGSLVAGAEPVDSALAAITTKVKSATRYDDGAGYLYELYFEAEALYSARVLSALINSATVRVPSSELGLWPQMTLVWATGSPAEGSDESTAIIDAGFSVSGDCFVGCRQHFLRAVVTPTETTVYDRGGEPLPAGATQLQPTTIPWPGP
jgi:hypothetical protein